MLESQIGRDAVNYEPLTNLQHTILMRFSHNLEKAIIAFSWRVWVSKHDFDNSQGDSQHIQELARDFSLKESEYESFINTFGSIISQTDQKISEIFAINSQTHRLTSYEIDGFNRVLQFNALPNQGELDLLNNKRTDVNDAFNLTVQANREFLASVGGVCLQYAANRGGFYKQLLENIQREMAVNQGE